MSVSRPSSRASSHAQDPEPSVALGAGAGDFGQDWTDDEDDVELDALLARAKLSAAKRATMKKQQKRKTSPGDGDGDGDAEDAERDAELDAVLSEDSEDATQDQKPPPLYIGWGLTMRDLIDSTAQAGDDELRVAAPAPPEPAFELDAEGRRVTKRDKKERKSATAGPGWFGLPAPPAAELPRLLREAEATRLRNQLDPKRFYRKEEGLPKYFAIGQIVSAPSPFGAAPKDTLPRASAASSRGSSTTPRRGATQSASSPSSPQDAARHEGRPAAQVDYRPVSSLLCSWSP